MLYKFLIPLAVLLVLISAGVYLQSHKAEYFDLKSIDDVSFDVLNQEMTSALNTETENDKKSEPKSDSAPQYADPASCDALTNAKTYDENDADFMYMLPGRESWVFRSRQDLQIRFDITDSDIAMYQTLVQALKSKGTELIIAYIPTRGMIASEFLPENSAIVDGYQAQAARENYNAAIQKMQEQGIHIVGDSAPDTGARYFNHADQHWTTAGARSMANSVASFIKNLPMASSLPHRDYKTTQGKSVTYDGRFGEFIKEKCGFRPSEELDFLVKTERITSQDNAIENDLFGEDERPQIVLIGTSNSKREEFNSNFDGYLKEALSADVYNAAVAGGGIDDSLLAYLGSDMFQKTPPKFLIWEIPGYYSLGGNVVEDAVRQAVSSIAGVCENPIAAYAQTELDGKKTLLFKGLKELNIGVGQAYVAIQFEKPLAKDFSISVKTGDRKNQKFKFKKRREGNGTVFYYWPKGDADLILDSVTLNANSKISGLVAEAQLCPAVPYMAR